MKAKVTNTEYKNCILLIQVKRPNFYIQYLYIVNLHLCHIIELSTLDNNNKTSNTNNNRLITVMDVLVHMRLFGQYKMTD